METRVGITFVPGILLVAAILAGLIAIVVLVLWSATARRWVGVVLAVALAAVVVTVAVATLLPVVVGTRTSVDAGPPQPVSVTAAAQPWTADGDPSFVADVYPSEAAAAKPPPPPPRKKKRRR